MKFDDVSGRFKVRLEGTKQLLSIKPANLELAPSSPAGPANSPEEVADFTAFVDNLMGAEESKPDGKGGESQSGSPSISSIGGGLSANLGALQGAVQEQQAQSPDGRIHANHDHGAASEAARGQLVAKLAESAYEAYAVQYFIYKT